MIIYSINIVGREGEVKKSTLSMLTEIKIMDDPLSFRNGKISKKSL